MLIRIVKMTFIPSEIENFKSLFQQNKHRIRNFEGCHHLELLQDMNTETVFFTYSYWKDETDLNKYRNSDLFKGIWTNTKKLFSEKPEAWSVLKV